MTKVLKFGGTSMGDEQTWEKVLDIISGYSSPAVVVSATARTTRRLLAAANEAVEDPDAAFRESSEIKSRHEQLINRFLSHSQHDAGEQIKQNCLAWIDRQISFLDDTLRSIHRQGRLSPAAKDEVASIGERLSSRLLVECGKSRGHAMTFIDAREVIHTNADFGNATPDFDLISKNARQLQEVIDKGGIPVIGGYYGSTGEGVTTTLGFEGSDYTASLLGAALDSESIEIWTDVSGIYTCDPRVVAEARPLPRLSFREATEMAYFGAKVLHPSTLNPAARQNIPVHVKNIFHPEEAGTRIDNHSDDNGLARAITFMEDAIILTITSAGTLMGYRFLSEIFGILENHHLNVDVVTTTEASLSIAITRPDQLGTIRSRLEALGEVELTEERGIVSLIGCSFDHFEAISNYVFSAVADIDVSMISYSRAKKNLNIVIPAEHLIDTVKTLHQSLFDR